MTNATDSASYPHHISQFNRLVSHSRLTGETGQGLIELALTLPLLILILLGGAEFARFAWASIETSNAARAGAQYGAQTDITANDNAGMQAAALNDGVNLTGLTATPTPSHWCACSTAPTASIGCLNALNSCASPAIVLEYVQVNTSSTISPLFHWPGLPATFTANGSALMQVAQP
jgi:Flp pilus assembly protein TadG